MPDNFSKPKDNSGGPQPDALVAANIIRQKISGLYADEPSAQDEITEADSVATRSRHQQYMYELGTSGKDLATVQTEWHDYYQNLSDAEKHQVWQEFYDSRGALATHAVPSNHTNSHNTLSLASNRHPTKRKPARPKTSKPRLDNRTAQTIQSTIRDSVSAGGKLGVKQHIQSLLFGLGVGSIVIVIFLFGFFNEVFLAPFIQPSRASAATPIIIGTESIAPTDKTEVIIPKINVEIPVNYDENSTLESDIETDLESGVVHYPTTVRPGETGNSVFFGHSSNNIFSKGRYKFAFVSLHTIVVGDTFYLTYSGKIYVYKVITRNVVDPTEIGVLGPVAGQTATATLITCDPPGTSSRRLIVVGQQISPDPTGNIAPPTSKATGAPINLPGNGPTLFTRMIRTVVGKAATIAFLLLSFVIIVRWVNGPSRRKK